MNLVNTYGRSINDDTQLLENRNFRSCCWLFVFICVGFLSTFAYFDFACGNLIGGNVDSACMFYSAYILIGILGGACAVLVLTCALMKYCCFRCARRRQFILIQEPINEF